jgi:hypothetical protein
MTGILLVFPPVRAWAPTSLIAGSQALPTEYLRTKVTGRGDFLFHRDSSFSFVGVQSELLLIRAVRLFCPPLRTHEHL